MYFINQKSFSPRRRGDAENPTLTLTLSLMERENSNSLPFKGRARVGMGFFSASQPLSGKLNFLLLGLFFVLSGCGGMADDLNPSGADKRPSVAAGTTGTQVGQTAPDFQVTDSLGNTRTLSSELAALGPGNALVYYFTMWCPICDSHQTNMLSAVVPVFPNSRFYLVDYVSGSIQGARDAEVSNGYSGSGFIILADTDRSRLNLFNATMSTTIVIDKSGTVRMNEDYKDGSRLVVTLVSLK